jgi:two-component system sensor kinase FixL
MHKVLNVAIVGGGPGCKAIMDMIFAKKLSQLKMKLIGVASTNESAAGYCYARQMGIYTTTDFHDLYSLPGLDMIIELTGREEVTNEIYRTKPDDVRVMGNVAARLFWDVFQIEEESFEKEKKAEAEIRESQERLKTILDSVQAGIIIIDPAMYVIVDANPVALRMIEAPREQVVGATCWSFFCPDNEGKCPIVHMGKTIDNSQRYLQTPAGKRVPILKTVVPVVLDGRPHFLESFLDITDRIRAEEELRESQQRYYTVLEATPDPVVVYDMEGNGLYINPAFTRVFGWTPDEILGRKLRYVPEENWPETKMMIDKVLGGQSFSGVESRRYTKAGHIINVSISAAIFTDRDGRQAGSVHVLRDISERKAVEAALKKAHDELEQRVAERTAKLAAATERLEQELAKRAHIEEALRVAHRDLAIEADNLQAANEELSQYAYAVSHDLKAPLRAIHNYSDFLREDLEAVLGDDQKTYLNSLNRAVHQGEELVNDLLEFSRVGAESHPADDIELGAFFRELVSCLDLPPDVDVIIQDDWPSIKAIPTLLRQIFENLIRNAIKFNRSPRKRIQVGWQPGENGRIELFVRDNGIGIDPRHYEQIFRVFQRLHTRDEYAGTGLGLAIVKKAASKLRGTVRVESKVGEGSTFFVSLLKPKRESSP